MFGYIAPCRPELRIREEKEYKAWYCGLCRELGHRYGQTARLGLSYDCAFIALLLSGASGLGGWDMARCPYKPAPKRPMASPCWPVAYGADLNVLLAWYKMQDDWQDERKPLAGLGRMAWRGYARRAEQRAPELAQAVEAGIRELTALEKENCKELDAPADAFARMMRAVGRAAPLTDSSGRVMPHVLYHLGRWVYLIDAWDDRHKDREKGAYNPFLAAGASREQAAFLLHLSLNEATDAYELLGIDLHKGLLDNIIYVGCPGNTRRILEDKDEQSL